MSCDPQARALPATWLTKLVPQQRLQPAARCGGTSQRPGGAELRERFKSTHGRRCPKSTQTMDITWYNNGFIAPNYGYYYRILALPCMALAFCDPEMKLTPPFADLKPWQSFCDVARKCSIAFLFVVNILSAFASAFAKLLQPWKCHPKHSPMDATLW